MSKPVKEYFESVFPEKLKANPQLVSNINAVFVFEIEGEGGGKWTIDLKKEGGEIREGADEGADCTIIMNSEDFVAMMEKLANPMQLYMSQKLKIKGNMALALKLQDLIK